jgi:protein SCO1/2
MTPQQGRIALVAAALIAALAGFGLARELDSKAPELASGTWLPQARPVGDFHLTDTRGQPFTARELRGRPSLVFFGFTHCPDVCPITMAKLAMVKKQASTVPLKVLFVTVDPARDTPPVLERYVHAFDPEFTGLIADPATLESLAARFGVAINRVPLPGGDYTMDHSAVIFLLDGQGEIVGLFTPPFDTERLAADLKRAAPYLQASD